MNRMRGLALVVGGVLAACVVEAPPHEDPGDNVILVTLDGVRRREVFGGPDPALAPGDRDPIFPRLLASLSDGAVMYGDPRQFLPMTTCNQAQVSIPGYMSIFTGYEQPCYDNECPPVGVETVLEYVQRARGLEPGAVAAFASWAKMGRAIEHVTGTITGDIGPAEDATDRAAEWARWDRDTFAAAMQYLDERRPRLLYVSLLDADSWGHEGRYDRHLEALRQYDRWIDELRAKLATMGEYGARTTLVVTTDHGRGDGELWTDHNSSLPGSEGVWLYAIGPRVLGGPSPQGRHTHADIRPTIEVLFGLPPSACERCGQPLAEVVDGPEPSLRAADLGHALGRS